MTTRRRTRTAPRTSPAIVPAGSDVFDEADVPPLEFLGGAEDEIAGSLARALNSDKIFIGSRFFLPQSKLLPLVIDMHMY